MWSHLKRSLANLTKHTLAELTALVKTRLKRMQYRPGLLVGFLVSTGLQCGSFLQPPPLRVFRRVSPFGGHGRRGCGCGRKVFRLGL